MARFEIDLPEELRGAGEAFRQLVEETKRRLQTAKDGRAVDYGAVEKSVEGGTAKVERELHRGLLQGLDIDADQVLIRGKAYTKVGRYKGTYKTKAGPVEVTRSLYREVGQRNAKTVDPVSLRAGVVEDGWLPDTAKGMAFLLQQGTSREGEQTAGQLGRLPYSRSSFERVGHVVGERNRQLHADIEDVLIEKYEIPKEAKSVSAGLDRVSIPMEEEVPRPPGRPPKDAPKKSIARNFRMAYVGTITLHDAEGEALHTIRYGTMPQGDVGALCESLGGDIAALLSKRPELKVAALVDGAPEMRNLLRTEITEGALGTPVRELVDFWHTAEKLGKAATVIYGSEGEAKANFKRWRFALLNRDGAAESILDELRQSGHEQTWYGGTQPVHEAITYLNNNLDRMAYARARREGLPIGSGNTEATCKSLFEIRMKRSGSRWKEETGEHVVGLRALALSNRWDDAITLTLRDLRAAVRRAA